MAEISKQALKVQNNTEFPNNNAGAITPTNLRTFNVNMIDSLVDEITYNEDSASWNVSIDALNTFTASASGLQTGSLLVTASASGNTITFTKGDASTFNVTVATGSIPDISNLNQATASLQAYTASANIRFTNLESTTASLNTSVTNINTFTSSAEISITNLNQSSASQQVSIDNLNGATGSYATTGSNTFVGANTFTSISASSFVSASQFVGDGSKITGITASISMPILDEGIPQGNAVSLNFTGSGISAIVVGGTAVVSVNIPDASVLNALTASFNSYTASTDLDLAAIHQATASLEANSASVNTSISALNTFTASQSTASLVTSIDNLNQFSASALVSIDNINSTTASLNTSITNVNAATASLFTSVNNINSTTASLNTSASLSLVTASFDNGTRNLTFTKGDTQTFSVNIPDISGSTGNFATTGSNTFNGNQIVNGYVSASADVSGLNIRVGDTGNFRFLSGSSYYNVQLVPGTGGDLAFSRDGDSNVKTLVLGGAAGNVTSFQNNPIEFQSTVGGVTLSTPLIINSGINSNVQLTGSINVSNIPNSNVAGTGSNTFTDKQTISANGIEITGSVFLTPTSVSTNAQYVIPFISGSTLSKDSVDTLFYNPSSNLLQVSSSVGSGTFSNQTISLTSGSGATIYSTSISKNSITQVSEQGYTIGMSGNPSKIGAPSVASNTKPAIFALSSSSQPYVAIELENSQSFTDGRVTFPRNVAMLQNLEITGSLTASLTEGYAWVGDGNNKTTLVATSSFGSVINTGSFATTGSNTFNGNQTINGVFNTNLPTASSESQTNIFNWAPFLGANGTTYTSANFSLQDYASSGIDQQFVIEYANADFQKYTGFVIGPTAGGAKAQFSINTGTGYDFDEISITDNGNNTSTALIKADTNIIVGTTQLTGSLGVSSTFTASLQDGYVWVGNAAGRTTTVATSSFGGGGAAFPYTGDAQISGSLGVTGSLSGFVNTLAISSNTASMNFNDGNFFRLQLVSGSTTHLTATNIRPGQTINLLVLTDSGSAGGSGSLAFSPEFKFAGGFDYTPTAITASQDLVSFVTFDTTQILAASIKNLL